MMPQRWGGRGQGLWKAILYVASFIVILVGLPALIVMERWWFRPQGPSEFTIRLLREDLGKVVEMDLEDYLVGVVAAEMPADFHLEALRAQAVAARTYALYRLGEQRETPGQDADLSSDFRSGQAWMSAEALRERWGWYNYLQKRWRIISSVEATKGEVLTYQGKPIFAAYHSTSGGETQDSGEYFNELAYLRGVPSPGEEGSPYYQTSKYVSWQEVASLLNIDIPTESLLDLTALFCITEHYPTGRVKTVEALGHSFTGRQIREKLGLRSNWFTVATSSDGVLFETKGNGHGVGMSQYGAQGMAMRGYSYRDILHHYYTGVELVKWY
jgi:stage II sporulation protein D